MPCWRLRSEQPRLYLCIGLQGSLFEQPASETAQCTEPHAGCLMAFLSPLLPIGRALGTFLIKWEMTFWWGWDWWTAPFAALHATDHLLPGEDGLAPFFQTWRREDDHPYRWKRWIREDTDHRHLLFLSSNKTFIACQKVEPGVCPSSRSSKGSGAKDHPEPHAMPHWCHTRRPVRDDL